MKETYNFLQTYEICFKLIYLKLLQEYFNYEIVGFTDKAVGEIAVKTVAINTVAGAVDAGTKDIVTHTIKGESQTFGELANTMFKGALSASLFSSFTQVTIFNGTTTSGQVGNLFTGTMANFNVNQPQWAGSVGIFGENILPLVYDNYNTIKGQKYEE